MMKVLLGRVLPMGAAIALLSSSASPLSGALNGFTHAANALGGAQNENTSDMDMPDEASVNAALGEMGGGGFSLGKMFKSLFGNSESDKAKAQLDQIIANVKGRSASGQPGIPVEGLPPGTNVGKGATGKGTTGKGPGTGKGPAGKGGKPGAGTTGKGTGSGKGTAGTDKGGTQTPPTPDPAAPPPGTAPGSGEGT